MNNIDNKIQEIQEYFKKSKIIPIKTKFIDRFVDQTWLVCK